MAYRLQVSLRNPGNQPISPVIYPGTVFEVVDPFQRVQNLAAVGTTQVTIPAGGRTVIDIDTWCLNRSFSPPSNTSMRLTRLRLARTYADQADLWNDMDARR